MSSPDTRQDVEDLHDRHMEIFGDGDAAYDEQSHSSRCPQQPPARIERRKVTLDEAESLLSSFRQQVAYFPFVQISAGSTVPSLSRTSPFLLLAILTTASIRDPPLYHQLDHEFKRILSTKVIVEGRKSLDFIQGILVYVAWYPLHANPKNNQAFMYINLAITIASDLGLDREIPNLSSFSNIGFEGLIEGISFTDAAKRAYLGGYYLSTALSLSFQKHPELRYCKLMDSYGQSLVLQESSAEISSLIKLQRLSKRIAEAHSSEEPQGDPQMEALNSEVNIQVYQYELQEWRNSTPLLIRNLPFIGIAERHVGCAIYSYQLGFLRRPYRDYLRSTASSGLANQIHLEKCLEASKKFFEYLLSLPETTYLNFTVIQWSSVVHGILVLSRLTFLMAANLGWDSDTTRSNVPLVMYLDALCYRFQHLSLTPSDTVEPPQNPDVLYVFRMILRSCKKSYERRVSKIEPGFMVVDHTNVIGVARGHCPILDPTLNPLFDIPDSAYEGSYELSDSTTPGSSSTAGYVPQYHDIWAVMSGSWAKEF